MTPEARRAIIGLRQAKPYVQYHPTLREEALSAIGCAAQAIGILVALFVAWTFFAVLLDGVK